MKNNFKKYRQTTVAKKIASVTNQSEIHPLIVIPDSNKFSGLFKAVLRTGSNGSYESNLPILSPT
jgi:hypothetical protein